MLHSIVSIKKFWVLIKVYSLGRKHNISLLTFKVLWSFLCKSHWYCLDIATLCGCKLTGWQFLCMKASAHVVEGGTQLPAETAKHTPNTCGSCNSLWVAILSPGNMMKLVQVWSWVNDIMQVLCDWQTYYVWISIYSKGGWSNTWLTVSEICVSNHSLLVKHAFTGSKVWFP
jgi:hypothetical protein